MNTENSITDLVDLVGILLAKKPKSKKLHKTIKNEDYFNR